MWNWLKTNVFTRKGAMLALSLAAALLPAQTVAAKGAAIVGQALANGLLTNKDAEHLDEQKLLQALIALDPSSPAAEIAQAGLDAWAKGLSTPVDVEQLLARLKQQG